jgi:hypothetical protein
LRIVIAAFVVQGNIYSRVLAAAAGNIGELGQALAALSTRLQQIETTLATLANWAKEQHRNADDDQSAADWWKN